MRPSPSRLRSSPHRLSGLIPTALLVLAGCSPSHVLAPLPAPETSLPINYSVEIDSTLDTPRNVRNSEATGTYRPGAPAPFSDAEAFQIVRRFVEHYAPVFRFRPGVDDFTPTWAQGENGINLVKVQQTYLGLPVDVMGYGTAVLPNGHVGSMIGSFMADIHVSTIPLVRAESAGARAVEALEPTVVRLLGAPRLTITTYDRVPRLTWTAIVAGGYGTWTVNVDAQRGTVLGVFPNFILN